MIINIIKKELRELVTRATILSIVMMALIFIFVGQVIGSAREEASKMPVMAVVDYDNTPISSIMTRSLERIASIVYSGEDIIEARVKLKEEKGTAIVILPSGFEKTILNGSQSEVKVEWYVRGTGLTQTIPASVVEELLNQAQKDVSVAIIKEYSDLNPDSVLNPVKITEVTYFKDKILTGISPNDLNNVISSQSIAIPVAIMMLIIMAGNSLISSMGMEKENKTLETLLTMPIKRSYIITGKIVASAIVSLIMAIVYMAGFSYYLGGLSDNIINPADFGLSLNPLDYLLIGVLVFLALLAALAISIVLGSFSTSYRSAQNLTFPLIGVAMFAMFINLFMDFESMSLPLKILVFIIPFSHPMMAMKELMFDNYLLVLSGIGYTVLFTMAMIGIAVWIFNSDRLLTGRIEHRTVGKRKISGLFS